MKKGIWFAIMFAGFFVLNPNFVFAEKMQVTPIIQRIELNGGDEFSFDYKIKSEETGEYVIRLADFTAGENGENIVFLDNSDYLPFSALSWIVIQEQNIVVKAGQEKIIPITIKVPKNVNPGGYYTSIIAEKKQQKSNVNDGARLLLTQSIASLIFVEIPGEVKESGTVLDIFHPTIVGLSKKIPFYITALNEGTVFSTVAGEIAISIPFFGEQNRQPITKAESRYVLPNEKKKIFVEVENVNSWYVGPVIAEVSVVFGRENRVIAKEKFIMLNVSVKTLSLVSVLVCLFLAMRFFAKKKFARIKIFRVYKKRGDHLFVVCVIFLSIIAVVWLLTAV